MSATLRRRIERMERILQSVPGPEEIERLVAILTAARHKSASPTQSDQAVHTPPPELPEEIRHRARELRQRVQAQLRIQSALKREKR